MAVTFDLEDKSTVAMWCWAMSRKRDLLLEQNAPPSDVAFLDNAFEMLCDGKTVQLEQLWSRLDCAADDAVCAEMDKAYREVYGEGQNDEDLWTDSEYEPIDESTPHITLVTKQTRKRDKRKKDEKRRMYAKTSYACGTPRVKGTSEYVLPARQYNWKKCLKTKANRKVRHHKGYLPRGNGYKKLDDSLWCWW